MVRNAVVNLARQRAAEALRAKGVTNDVIDRLPSIEDGFVNWISRSDMPMDAIDDMLQSRGGFVEPSDLSNIVEKTTGHAPPAWVIDLLMTSMDADGDGLLSNTEVWTWAHDRGLEVPAHLMATEEPEPAPEPEPVPEAQPEAAPTPDVQEAPAPMPEPIRAEPARTQPMERRKAAAAASQSSLEGLLNAFSQNLRGDEIQAILDANTHAFHITGTVEGNKATLLGEAGWRDGRTLTVATMLGEVDVQLHSAALTDLRVVNHQVMLYDWNRGLARPVFRLV